MKDINHNLFITLIIISNTVAVLQLMAAFKWPRITRLSFFLLFAWASWTNWTTALHNPGVYLEYADLTPFGTYEDFIRGWFAEHIQLAVGFIATCQGLIALSMLMKGWTFIIGAIGAILFLLAILPLGQGSAFPCTGIMAIALFVLLKKYKPEFIWKRNTNWSVTV